MYNQSIPLPISFEITSLHEKITRAALSDHGLMKAAVLIFILIFFCQNGFCTGVNTYYWSHSPSICTNEFFCKHVFSIAMHFYVQITERRSHLYPKINCSKFLFFIG